MSQIMQAAHVVARYENVGVQYALAKYSEQELLSRARRYNRERERDMDAVREAW